MLLNNIKKLITPLQFKFSKPCTFQCSCHVELFLKIEGSHHQFENVQGLEN